MQRSFFKYQATGNDFILVDNRDNTFPKKDTKTIARLCHRRFGIGADGLILLETDKSTDFRMVYFNADGREGSMCGNGGRCMVAFANYLGIIEDSCRFAAVDGPHEGHLENGRVSLQMQDVKEVHDTPHYLWLDTGSPHHVQLWEPWDTLDVDREGERLRYGLYGPGGSNINFVHPLGENRFEVRTYERGVEAETYSCGTGVTAVALGMHHLGHLSGSPAVIKTLGGTLEVRFSSGTEGYSNIWLVGPAELVFKGELP
ncbi:MAG: diaminopimelate epimerase [Robiginitalea sp.]